MIAEIRWRSTIEAKCRSEKCKWLYIWNQHHKMEQKPNKTTTHSNKEQINKIKIIEWIHNSYRRSTNFCFSDFWNGILHTFLDDIIKNIGVKPLLSGFISADLSLNEMTHCSILIVTLHVLSGSIDSAHTSILTCESVGMHMFCSKDSCTCFSKSQWSVHVSDQA